ncbi:MAG: ABC transporter permease, partial [Nakamurella sp.]
MRYVTRKVVLFVLTLWAALTLNFALPRLMPGSPLDAALSNLQANGVQVTNAMRDAMAAQLGGSNGNWLSQYFSYLGNTARLNFGTSFSFPTQSVSHTILQALPWTVCLVGVTTIVAFVLGTL